MGGSRASRKEAFEPLPQPNGVAGWGEVRSLPRNEMKPGTDDREDGRSWRYNGS